METNKSVTAVEWLVQVVQSCIAPDYIPKEIVEQAKAMEKEQIMDAYKKAHEDGYHFEGSASDYEAEGLEKHLAEQYYNETFKSE